MTKNLEEIVINGALNSSGLRACVKQEVYAMIDTPYGQTIFGGNFMKNDITVCPREEQNMISGEGYHLCDEICGQEHHAESDAIANAQKLNIDLKESVLYLVGHTYCCNSCISKMNKAGISKCFIVKGVELQEINLKV